MEHALGLKILMIAYAFFNGARVLSYLPQIIAAAKDQTGARAISLLTWGFWSMANFTTALYAIFVVPDMLLAIMNAGNTLGCAIVFGIVWFKRMKYSKNHKLVGDLTQEFSNLTGTFTVGNNGLEKTQKVDTFLSDENKQKSNSVLFTDK